MSAVSLPAAMREPAPAPRYALRLSCRSESGQIAAVSGFLEREGLYIDEFSVFDDVPSQRFYVRATFMRRSGAPVDVPALRQGFASVAAGLPEVDWSLLDLQVRPRVLLMVSRFDHCLRDLLDGWRQGELPMDITAVVSNHPDLRPLVEAEGLPFHHLPVTADTKPAQEAALMRLIDEGRAEFVVLARYMQVLSAEACERLEGRVINIHHSFLPGFKGARPYHQAYERGVKLIGATAHFATHDLDEGPIIEQALERVDHAFTPEQLLATGRRIECLVLARALRYVLERRVFISGLRTVVLR